MQFDSRFAKKTMDVISIVSVQGISIRPFPGCENAVPSSEMRLVYFMLDMLFF